MSESDVIQEFYEKERKEKIDKYRILNEAVVNGNLKEEYTIEGVHMYANAYRCVLENLKQYL